jgi:tetratricopeptide (TPR) repeat protein
MRITRPFSFEASVRHWRGPTGRGVHLSSTASDPPALIAEALRLFGLGDLSMAEGACRSALAQTSQNTAAKTVLASVLLAQKRFGEAESTLTEVIEFEPAEPSHWVNLGTARRGLGEFEGALMAYAQAVSLGGSGADLYFNLGLTHLDRADFESARAVLDRARSLAPQDAEVRLRYAEACYRSLHNDDAVAALADWRTLELMGPRVLAQIGQLLVNLGRQKEGAEALGLALADSSADSSTVVTGIETFERINRLDDAHALIARLESNPQSVAAVAEDLLIIRARLAQRAGDHENAARLYKQALLAIEDDSLKYTELFPLAQSLDALGRFDESWATLQQAHRSQLDYLRRAAPGQALTGAPPMLITQHGCDPDDVAAWEDDAPPVEDSPIFIVAFPRSGTTLLEVTLDAHPALQSMDEQPFIQDALDEILSLSADYPRRLARLTRPELAGLRAHYWRRAAGKVNLSASTRLVDKNPLNILRLPVIRRLFPNSPVLLGVRHPCDVILSCYMQLFRAPEFALLCNSLPSIARGFQRTLDFWNRQSAILKPRALEVRYESLVANFDRDVRAIIDYLELPWDDRVLQPAESARRIGYISTPSYAQVMRPVSASSVGRWQHYAHAFASLIPAIQHLLDRWSYAAVVAVDGVSPNNK